MSSLLNSFYYFEENSAATEKIGKYCPQMSQGRWLGFWHRSLWKGKGPAIPSLRALQWSQPAFGNKVVASNSLATILPPFSQTQTETHKAESNLMNLPAHALISQMRRLWSRCGKWLAQGRIPCWGKNGIGAQFPGSQHSALSTLHIKQVLIGQLLYTWGNVMTVSVVSFEL